MPTSRAARRQIGDYEQIRKIGSGGMGQVYLARHRQDQTIVALKVLHRKYAKQREPLARFLTEARVVQQLAHPNIVSLYDASDGSDGFDPFIALEYVEGASLAAALGKSWEPGDVLRLISEAAGALDAVHSQAIIHRDLKPSNIMIRSDGRLKLVDFGLARLLARPAWAASHTLLRTRAGSFLGTVKYTSPECARGQEATFASDVFSLGIVFYQLAAGVYPFEADNEARVLEAIRSQRPIRPRHFNPAITPGLEDLLMAMLSRDAAARPTAAQIAAAANATAGPQGVPPGPRARRARPALIGRRAERATLERLLNAAASGEGAMICISGEAGFGKTTLAESVLAGASGFVASGFLVARGRCSERLDGAGHAGANLAGSEAYMPVLESLGELLRGEIAGPASKLLQRVAPSWYAWISGVKATPVSPAVLKEQYLTFLRALAEGRPIALFLDDLHWSDVSTADLLNYLAGRLDGTPLAIVATYRPSDLALSGHPFARIKSELAARKQCHEITLGPLAPADIDAYIAAEYPENNFPSRFSEVMHRVSGGVPLFLAGILRDLRSRGTIEQHGGVWELMSSIEAIRLELPSSIAEVIERRIARLSERERELLLAAAAQGPEFDSAVAGSVLGRPSTEIEDTLLDLDRFHRLVAHSRDRDLPDGTPTRTYVFVHVLYHQHLYKGMTESRRIQLSARVAEALQAFHGERAKEIAASLAFLYRTARKPLKALPFFIAAADAARRLTAHSEAVNFARLALEMVEKLPAGPERDSRELSVRLLLGGALMATRSYADPLVVNNYARAGELIGDRDADPRFFPIRLGQWATSIMSTRLVTACRMAEDLIAFSERADAGRRKILLSGACMAHGLTLTQLGRFVQSTRQLERAAEYDAVSNSAGAMLFPLAPGVGSRAQLALNYWYLGYPDRAVSTGLDCIRVAGTDAYGRAFAQMYLAGVHQLRGEPEIVADLSSRAMAIAEKPEHRYTEVFHWSSIRHGWAVAKLGNLAEGAAQMRESLAANKANGSKAARAHFLSLMGMVLIEFDRLDEAHDVITEALATIDETSSRFYLSEALRLKGELCLRRMRNASEAEQFFNEGLAVAREPEQSCRGFELRLLMSVVRLDDFIGRASRESRQELQAALNLYDEGLGTSDLIEARKLLELQPA